MYNFSHSFRNTTFELEEKFHRLSRNVRMSQQNVIKRVQKGVLLQAEEAILYK